MTRRVSLIIVDFTTTSISNTLQKSEFRTMAEIPSTAKAVELDKGGLLQASVLAGEEAEKVTIVSFALKVVIVRCGVQMPIG